MILTQLPPEAWKLPELPDHVHRQFMPLHCSCFSHSSFMQVNCSSAGLGIHVDGYSDLHLTITVPSLPYLSWAVGHNTKYWTTSSRRLFEARIVPADPDRLGHLSTMSDSCVNVEFHTHMLDGVDSRCHTQCSAPQPLSRAWHLDRLEDGSFPRIKSGVAVEKARFLCRDVIV